MDNVNESKWVTFINPNVHQIEMLWKHVATATFLQKVHVSDIVTFKMDVLLVILNLAFQKRAEPSYESFWLFLQELKVLISTLVDVGRKLNSVFVG